MTEYVSRAVKGQLHTSTNLPNPHPILPFPLYLDNLLVQTSFFKLWLERSRLLNWEHLQSSCHWVSSPSIFETRNKFKNKKKWEKFLLFFYPNPYPRPWTALVFVRIVLTSKWTGVSLKGYRQNLQETAPAEENVNQLLNTTCNKWHFNRLLKHVQQSIIQLYLQKVTL